METQCIIFLFCSPERKGCLMSYKRIVSLGVLFLKAKLDLATELYSVCKNQTK